MKLTATSLFNSIANGSSKIVQWKVYVRKVTSLSEKEVKSLLIDFGTRTKTLENEVDL